MALLDLILHSLIYHYYVKSKQELRGRNLEAETMEKVCSLAHVHRCHCHQLLLLSSL